MSLRAIHNAVAVLAIVIALCILAGILAGT